MIGADCVEPDSKGGYSACHNTTIPSRLCSRPAMSTGITDFNLVPDIKLGLALGSAPHRFRRNAVATGGWADAHNSFSLGPMDEFGKWNGSCIQSALDRAGTRFDTNMESRATETAPSQAKLFAL